MFHPTCYCDQGLSHRDHRHHHDYHYNAPLCIRHYNMNLSYPNLLELFPADTFSCDFCTRSFPSLGLLSRHNSIHSAALTLVCPFCSRLFHSEDAYSVHIRTRHSNESGDNNPEVPFPPLPCTICGRKYPAKRALSTHIQRCHMSPHSTRPPLSPQFSKGFSLELPNELPRETYRFESALPLPTPQEPEFRYHCPMCPVSFPSAQLLKVHSQVRHSQSGVLIYDLI